MRIASIVVAASLPLLAGTTLARASTVITQWNFNVPIGTNNSPAPSVGTGTATPVGMTNNANNADILSNAGSSDVGNSLAWRVRGSVSNGWSGTTQLLSGARFNASTATFENIVVSFDLFATDGSPRHGQFQYTLDGSTFTSFGAILDFNPGDAWRNNISFDLSGIPGASNNPNFGFQIVSAFSPVEFTNANGIQAANTAFQRANASPQVYNGTAGNWRLDTVTFSGTLIPTPGAAGLLALAGLAGLRRRR
jgi:hypothetical protein